MSKLYGTLQGNRGEVTKCGSAQSGLRVSAQSWNGSLITYMGLNKDDTPVVTLRIAEGSSSYGGDVVFVGTLDELKAKLRG